MSLKKIKTNIGRKLGWVGLVEFTDDPVASNSLEGWNSLFKNECFLKSYIESSRMSFYAELISKINQSAILENVNSVIDIGCGTGHLLSEIKKYHPHLSLTGTDFSEQTIVVAKKTLPNAEFLTSDIYDLPESLIGQYDVVICTEVLEHLLYPEKALNNLIKLLKNKKGCLILSVPNGRRDTYEGHINFWSPESWKIFIESNCKNMKIECYLIENKMTNLAIIYL